MTSRWTRRREREAIAAAARAARLEDQKHVTPGYRRRASTKAAVRRLVRGAVRDGIRTPAGAPFPRDRIVPRLWSFAQAEALRWYAPGGKGREREMERVRS